MMIIAYFMLIAYSFYHHHVHYAIYHVITSLKSVLNVTDHSKGKDALQTNTEGTDTWRAMSLMMMITMSDDDDYDK